MVCYLDERSQEAAPKKLYFSIDNSTATNASARLDFAACKPFLGIGPADTSLKLVPGYDYWHVLGEEPLVKKARRAKKASRNPEPTTRPSQSATHQLQLSPKQTHPLMHCL